MKNKINTDGIGLGHFHNDPLWIILGMILSISITGIIANAVLGILYIVL